jgi:hypothetical protein
MLQPLRDPSKLFIMPPPTPSIQPIPVFDYVIDIYSDKVIVTNPDGSTTQLSTISDLNNWLRNVTGKRIRINANVEVTADVTLTSNEYWIFGNTLQYLWLLSKITLYAYAPIGWLVNCDPSKLSDADRQREYFDACREDISNSIIYIDYGFYVNIAGSQTTLNNIFIYANNVAYGSFENLDGASIVARGSDIDVYTTTVKLLILEVFDELWFGDITALDGAVVVMISHGYTDIGSIDLSKANVGRLRLLLTVMKDITLPASGTVNYDLGSLTSNIILPSGVNTLVEIEGIQIGRAITMSVQGITAVYNPSTNNLAITSNLGTSQIVYVKARITAPHVTA